MRYAEPAHGSDLNGDGDALDDFLEARAARKGVAPDELAYDLLGGAGA